MPLLSMIVCIRVREQPPLASQVQRTSSTIVPPPERTSVLRLRHVPASALGLPVPPVPLVPPVLPAPPVVPNPTTRTPPSQAPSKTPANSRATQARARLWLRCMLSPGSRHRCPATGTLLAPSRRALSPATYRQYRHRRPRSPRGVATAT